MAEPAPFDYAVIRIVPHEERGEFINVGIILYSPTFRFLDAQFAFEPRRLAALAPDAKPEPLKEQLAAISQICAGTAAGGALSEMSLAERFRWLTAPRNTMIQTSPVHSGMSADPRATLEHLVKTMVSAPGTP